MIVRLYHRWPRFTLRYAFVALSLLCGAATGLALYRLNAVRVATAVKSLRTHQGVVVTTGEKATLWNGMLLDDTERMYATGIVIIGEAFNVALLRPLADSTEVETLAVVRAPVYDDDLAFLSNCTKLDTLYLHDTKITLHAFRHINKCPSITYLDISNTSITFEQAAGAARLPKLDTLLLADNEVLRHPPDTIALRNAFPSLVKLAVQTGENTEHLNSWQQVLTISVSPAARTNGRIGVERDY